MKASLPPCPVESEHTVGLSQNLDTKHFLTQFKPGKGWNVPDHTATRRAPPTKTNMTSKIGQVFVVEPETVVFTNYGAWGVGQVLR